MQCKRVKMWEKALFNIIREYKKKAFLWGIHDCALFAADVVYAITGNDFAAPFRGKYFDEASANQALVEFGAGDLESTVDSYLPIIEVLSAQRGDVVMYKQALGICLGYDCYFYDVDGEIKAIKLRMIDKAWRVG